MRLKRMNASCNVLLRMCPMWSTPVTLGGGITIVYGFLWGVTSAWKKRCSSQKEYHFFSTSAGEYTFARDESGCASDTKTLLDCSGERRASCGRVSGRRTVAPRCWYCPLGLSDGSSGGESHVQGGRWPDTVPCGARRRFLE